MAIVYKRDVLIDGKKVNVTFRFLSRLPALIGMGGITLGKTIRLKRLPNQIPSELLAHEVIHVMQMIDMKWTFYVRYVWELLTKGYKNISFEVEAYDTAHSIIDGTHPRIKISWLEHTTVPPINVGNIRVN